LLVGQLLMVGCHYTSPAGSAKTTTAPGKIIWTGTSHNLKVQWTSGDLFVNGNGLFSASANKKFKEFVAENTEDDEPGKPPEIMDCDFFDQFKLLSVVGTLASFEDQVGFVCEHAKGSNDTRFTTVDLAKGGQFDYSGGEESSDMDVDIRKPGPIVKLTDYFSDQDVLQALLADPVIKKAIASLKNSRIPQSAEELPKLFADDDYALGDADFELRPDYLTRFVFHHLEGDKVAVRLGLPPGAGYNSAEHMQIGLLLPIPPSLRPSLELAAAQKQGFLMADAPKLFQKQSTTFEFKTGKEHS